MQPPQPAPKDVVPVQADMETVCDHPTGQVNSAARFFRDEKSRTRVEHGDMVSINDPVKGESYVLNLPQKIAIPSQPSPAMPAMPSAPGMPNLAMPQPAMKPPQLQEIADLGEKVINGFKAQGKRYTMPAMPGMPAAAAMPAAPAAPAAPAMPGPPAIPAAPAAPAQPSMPKSPVSEVWTSPELKLPIQSSITDPKTGSTCVTQMKNIKPGAKLDPSMFQVPPDFKIAPPVKPPALPIKS